MQNVILRVARIIRSAYGNFARSYIGNYFIHMPIGLVVDQSIFNQIIF